MGVDAGKTVVDACCSHWPAGCKDRGVRDPYEVQTVVALGWYVWRLLLRGRVDVTKVIWKRVSRKVALWHLGAKLSRDPIIRTVRRLVRCHDLSP